MFAYTANLSSQWIKVESTGEAPLNAPVPLARIDSRGVSQSAIAKGGIVIARQTERAEYPNAQWLGAVQQRVVASVPPPGYILGHNLEDDGTWISQEVATTAISFFEKVSDTLAVEPYLYSSPAGDLVAEFSERDNRMTCVISQDAVTLISLKSGQLISERYAKKDWSVGPATSLRDQIVTLLPVQKNGPMGR